MTDTSRRNFLLAAALAAAGCATRASLDAPPTTMSLDEFMALSKRLTGVADLSPEHGRIYLASLRAATPAEILERWYTGVYPTPAGPRVATYTEALAWTTLGFTKAPSLCGGAMGYWADKPAPA